MLSGHLIKWAVIIIITGFHTSQTEQHKCLYCPDTMKKITPNFGIHLLLDITFQSSHSVDEGTEPERWGNLPTFTQIRDRARI